MANYYTQFCGIFGPISTFEKMWLEVQASEELLNINSSNTHPDDRADLIDTWIQKHRNPPPKTKLFLQKLFDNFEYLNFDMKFNELPGESWEVVFTCAADNTGSIEGPALLVHGLLKHFKQHDRTWTTQAAYTCDALLANSFCGDAAFVTSRGVRWMSTNGWCEKMARQFRAREEKRRAKASCYQA